VKDIDFDELDRAVSSLLTNKDEPTAIDASAGGASAPVPQDPSVDMPAPAEAPQEKPETPAAPANPPKATQAASKPATTTGETAFNLPTRSTGRFMDVVHPSSDMATNTSTTQPTPTLGRKLQPLNKDVKPEATATGAEVSPTTAESTESIISEGAPSVAPDAPPPAATVWPDPLDVHGFKDDLDAPASPAAVDTPADVSSPFLSDTKVEKRPLGAYADQAAQKAANDDTPATTPKANAESTTDAKAEPVADTKASELEGAKLPIDDPTIPKPPEQPEPLPPEFDSALIAVESGDRTEDEESRNEDEEPDKNSDVDDKKTILVKNGDKDDDMKLAPSPLPVANMSIPAQYKPVERSSADAEGHVFDTKDYHTPIAMTSKKKSSAGLWILFCVLLVSIVGGMAYWYLYLR
jgi:hypothetical protein